MTEHQTEPAEPMPIFYHLLGLGAVLLLIGLAVGWAARGVTHD